MSRDLVALTRFISARLNTPRAWGDNDCGSFALDAVEAATGVRVAPKLKWKSRVAALKIVSRFGSIEAAFDAHFERVPASFALPGDIAAVVGEQGALQDGFDIHPMVVEGVTLVCPGEVGLKRCKRKHMAFAWSATEPKQ